MAESKTPKDTEATAAAEEKAAAAPKAAAKKPAAKKPATAKAAVSEDGEAKAPAKKPAAKKPAKAAASEDGEAKAEAAKPAAKKAAAAKKAEAEAEVPASRTLRVHHLRPAPGSRTAKTRVGRGEGSKGKTAGRGTKGTKARYQVPAGFEGGQMPMHMRLPKLRGFTNPFRTEYQVVNLDKLAALFPQGGAVTVDSLVAAGAVRANRPVKVLGDGDLGGVKLEITADRFSASAKEKIEAAGGTVSQA